MIGTVLLGNNLVNILASALTTSLLISLFGEVGVAYATIGMTLLVVIFAEVLPKTYALAYSRPRFAGGGPDHERPHRGVAAVDGRGRV